MPAVNVREMNYGDRRRNLLLHQSSSSRSMDSSSGHQRKRTPPKRRGMLVRQDSKVRFAQEDDVKETLSRADLSTEEYQHSFYLPEEYEKMQKTAMICVKKIAANENIKVVAPTPRHPATTEEKQADDEVPVAPSPPSGSPKTGSAGVRKRRINGRGLEAMIEEKRAELNHEPYVDRSKVAVKAVLMQQSNLIVDDPDEEEQVIAELYHKMAISSVEEARERAKLDEKQATKTLEERIK